MCLCCECAAIKRVDTMHKQHSTHVISVIACTTAKGDGRGGPAGSAGVVMAINRVGTNGKTQWTENSMLHRQSCNGALEIRLRTNNGSLFRRFEFPLLQPEKEFAPGLRSVRIFRFVWSALLSWLWMSPWRDWVTPPLQWLSARLILLCTSQREGRSLDWTPGRSVCVCVLRRSRFTDLRVNCVCVRDFQVTQDTCERMKDAWRTTVEIYGQNYSLPQTQQPLSIEKKCLSGLWAVEDRTVLLGMC